MTRQPLKIGRPRIDEDRRLTVAVTARFTRGEADQLRAGAAAMAVRPTTAVRRLAMRGAGMVDPAVHVTAELRAVGEQLARIARALERRRRPPLAADEIAEFRAALAATSSAVAAVIAARAPRVEPMTHDWPGDDRRCRACGAAEGDPWPCPGGAQ